MGAAERVEMPSAGRKVLPHSQEAEESVVGGVLLYPKAFVHIADLVTAEDFYHPTLGAIFQAMVELDEGGKPIDAITVGEQMRANDSFGRLRAFGGEAFYAELMSKVITVDNIGYHAKIVRGKATVRKLIEVGQEWSAKGYGEYGDVEDFVEEVERSVAEVAGRTGRASYESVRKILGATVKAVELRYDRKQVVTGVPSGYHKLDAMTAGFQPSELAIIAARPSMGKTSLVMNAVQHAAIEHGVPALVFSLEMSKESLVERLLCSEGHIDSTRLRSGFLDQRDWINLTKAASRISEAPIWIDDSGAPSLLDIRAKARRWRADPNIFKSPEQLGIIVIDYLQLIAGRVSSGRHQRDRNREQELSEVSRGLKALAKELRVPVVALAQLNRALEGRKDKRPQLSDLRESGAIEQDADLIAFIYRDEVYNKQSPAKGTAEVIIGKQRNGATGTVRLAFVEQYTFFANLAHQDDA